MNISYGDGEPEHFVTIDENTHSVISACPSAWRVNLETLTPYQYRLNDMPFEARSLSKKMEIAHKADEFIYSLRYDYSSAEVESWAKQEHGAYDLQSDPESQTEDAQFVRRMAETRGVEVSVLVSRILNNVAKADLVISRVLGYMQRLQDMIDAIDPSASDKDEQLDAIDWPDDVAVFMGSE